MTKGSRQKNKGRMKEAVGKATQDKPEEMEGKMQKNAGKAREGMEKVAERSKVTGRDVKRRTT